MVLNGFLHTHSMFVVLYIHMYFLEDALKTFTLSTNGVIHSVVTVSRVSWLKVTSKELTYVHFPCTSSEQVKLMYFLT